MDQRGDSQPQQPGRPPISFSTRKGCLVDPTIVTSAGFLAMIANLIQAAAGAAGVLNGAKLKLFINDIDPGKAAVIGDFTLATFGGSTAIAVAAWNEAFLNGSGDAVILGAVAQWDWDSGDAETVYGVVLTTSADAILAYARLSVPKLMDDTADSLAVVPRYVVGDTGQGTFHLLAA